MSASRPRVPHGHLVETRLGRHLFVADGSRLFDVDAGLFGHLSGALKEEGASDAFAALLAESGLGGQPLIDDQPLAPPATHALSLAVAQKCNLGCTYCYAQQGEFGGTAGDMPPDVAKAAIDRLVQAAEPGETLTLAFMGGEPLVNRSTLHASTRYAAGEAAARGIRIGFSMTTNATLLCDEDIELFQEYGFTLTVSLDGLHATHDRLRPYRSGKGSFEKVAENVRSLLAVDRRRYRVLARVTVTPKNLDLPEIMTGLLE